MAANMQQVHHFCLVCVELDAYADIRRVHNPSRRGQWIGKALELFGTCFGRRVGLY